MSTLPTCFTKPKPLRFFLLLLSAIGLLGCTAKPNKVEPVTAFEMPRYLGTWYEIARLDHSFERGLSNVSAQYVKREDGGVDVINRGYKVEDQKWSQAEGKAYFVDDQTVGHLKVSFFGPFYSSYIVYELDTNYQYAFVSGYNHDYLWLLSRTPQVDDAVLEKFIASAKERGFDVSDLIIVDQNQPQNSN